MSCVVRINTSVYSRKGKDHDKNKDSYYINGKFISSEDVDSVQASYEGASSEFVFAIADNMQHKGLTAETTVSIMNEVSKFHEKISVNSGDFDYKTKEFITKIEESQKLISSLEDAKNSNLGYGAIERGFAGILLTEGKAIAVNVGNSRVYLLREGIFKHLTVDYTKTKRLLELGIISDEQAESLNEKFGVPTEIDMNTVQVSSDIELMEGDKFLICTNGIYDNISDEHIEEILSLRSDSTYIVNNLIKEASKRKDEDDATCLVISIDRIKGDISRRNQAISSLQQNSERKQAVSRANNNRSKTTTTGNKKYKYEGLLQVIFAILTTAILIGAVILFVKSMFNVKDTEINALVSPKPTTSIAPVTSQTPTPTVEPTPTPTPTPTPAPNVSVEEYYAKDNFKSLYSLAKEKYGDGMLYEALAKYNEAKHNYFDPDAVPWGQKILLPPKSELQKYK